MSIFESVKGAVSVREAAEGYGLSVSRSGMVRCPFHQDRRPSMKVDERFYCFGCHETGDVIDFTARLFGLGNYQAAQKLAADFGVSADAPPRIVRPKPPDLEPERQCIAALLELLHLLRRWKQIEPKGSGEGLDERFVMACQSLTATEQLVEAYLEGTQADRERLTRHLTATGNLSRLQGFLARRKEEANAQ